MTIDEIDFDDRDKQPGRRGLTVYNSIALRNFGNVESPDVPR